MRARLIDRRGAHVRLLAAAAVLALAASCSGADPDQVEASQASPEPTSEPPASSEPTEEPSDEPSESEPEEPEPTIGEDEPLYAPLPELTPDPENDVPDDIEQLILDAFAEAYDTEVGMYAAGVLDDARLERTHFGEGFDAAAETLRYLEEQGGRELSPDATVTAVFVRGFEGGAAIVRECAVTGPRTGLYDGDGRLLEAATQGPFARDRMMELVQREGEDEPRYRVTQVGFGPPEDC